MEAVTVKHLMKERTPKGIVSKCGAAVKADDVSVWWSDVDCPACSPYEWVPDRPGSKRMVRKADAPLDRRRTIPRQ